MKKYHLKRTMKKGLLYFHHGWADIINCLALINYYCKRYDIIYLIIKSECKELVDFYTRDIQNLKIIYIKHSKHSIIFANLNEFKNNYKNLNIKDSENLFVGVFDKYRTDKYKENFLKPNFFL